MKFVNIAALFLCLGVSNAIQGAVEITMNGDPTSQQGAKARKQMLKWDAAKNTIGTKVIPADTVAWNKGTGKSKDKKDICWVSREPFKKASPSLRACYSYTDQACCNYVQDESIASRFSDFLPDPCEGDFAELSLFQCVACRSTAVKFTIKAEAS